MTEPCQICGKEAVIRYPGNDPENGPARPYCPDGHSECEGCREWFTAIVTVPAFTARYDEDDPKSEVTVPESTHESSLCRKCEAQMMGFRDVEDMEAYERHEMARMHRSRGSRDLPDRGQALGLRLPVAPERSGDSGRCNR